MKNRWQEQEARKFRNDPLALRVYTSRSSDKTPIWFCKAAGTRPSK